MAGNDQAMRALDWAAARTADVVVRVVAKPLARRAKVGVGKRVRAAWRGPAAAAAVPPARNATWWSAPFMGSRLTRAGAAVTLAAAPVFWIVADLAWAALPA